MWNLEEFRLERSTRTGRLLQFAIFNQTFRSFIRQTKTIKGTDMDSGEQRWSETLTQGGVFKWFAYDSEFLPGKTDSTFKTWSNKGLNILHFVEGGKMSFQDFKD